MAQDRVIYAILYAIFAPIRWGSSLLPSEWKVEQQMRQAPSLQVRCSDEFILIEPTRKNHRSQRGATVIATVLRHFSPEVERYVAYRRADREAVRMLTGKEGCGPGIPIWHMPLRFPRSSTWYDEPAWQQLRLKAQSLHGPINLDELQRLEIAAYLESRSSDFDLNEYYMAYR